jgi:hypothetical protein
MGVSTNVRAFLPVVGEVTGLGQAFEGDPRPWLPSARREGSHHWLLTVRAGSLSRTVRATVGSPWRAGTTFWRSLSWDPLPGEHEPVSLDRFLPSMDGELGLHAELGGGTSTLVLDARYQPPGGVLGAAADAVALHRVARHTVERFVETVAAGLAAEAALHGPILEAEPRLADG